MAQVLVLDSVLSKNISMEQIDAQFAVAKYPARYSYVALPAAASDPFTVTVGASPFTFANRTGGKLELLVSGGTVSSISHTRPTANGPLTSATGITNGTVLTSSGDTVTVTYSVAPTMAAVPHL